MAKKVKRILFVSNTRLRFTNILTSMMLSLIEMGYYVRDLDVLQHPGITINMAGHQGGNGPIELSYDHVRDEIEAFKPHVILFAGGGLTFSKEVSEQLKSRGIILLGVTLSDPDVFETAKTYVDRFSFHATNSKKSFADYQKLGYSHTHYMPFGVDSRFFVPTLGVPNFQCDVTIIGHFQPSRLSMTDELKKRFDTKVFGSRWPYKNVKPVSYPEWLWAVHSGKIVVDFPKTRAGYQNVKVRLFEVAAAGTLLVTQYLDEIAEFFEYDKEIVGYRTVDEMYEKIQYYLDNSDKRIKIARKAQLKCAKQHMWKNRFRDLFEKIGV